MAISQQTLQAIKAAPLSALIEASGAKLKRVGREFVTKCLWHDDTNPSLTINDDKGFCFCHVCREGGDAIDYLRKKNGLTMREAVEAACSTLGIALELDDEDPEETSRRFQQRKEAITALGREHSLYRSNLKHPKATRIRQILKDRGIGPEASQEFEIGYAAQGFFAGRITLPIYDYRNDLVGFTGRACGDQLPKYKNSPDSDLFSKKLLVFNEQRAREAAREAGSLIVVEGHLDVVSMWQAGIKNVVAMQGTGAPDRSILQRWARNVKTIILCFDGDAGGKKAAEQFISVAGPMALEGELAINVATLPDGMDPDEVIRSGNNLYNYLASAPSWLDWLIDTWVSALDPNNTVEITTVEERLRQLIDKMRSKALRAHYIDKAARALTKTNKEAEKLAKQWGNREFFHSEAPWRPRTIIETRLAAERRLVRLYVHRPKLREPLSEMMKKLTSPPLLWLAKRLEEIETYSTRDLTPHTVMAIVSVAEPHYMQQLRTLIRPNVIIDDSPGVLAHLAAIMGDDQLPNEQTCEPDTDQLSTGRDT